MTTLITAAKETTLLPTPLLKLLPLFGKMSPHSLSKTGGVELTKTLLALTIPPATQGFQSVPSRFAARLCYSCAKTFLALTILPDRQAICTASTVDTVY